MEGTDPRRGIAKTWIVRVTVVVGAGALVGAVLLALAFTGVFNSGQDAGGSKMVTLFGHFDSPSDELRKDFYPTLTPPDEAPIATLVIPSLTVDAPVEAKGVDANGLMESPDGPWDVAWYYFTAKPGLGHNAVFSGHVDYVNVGPAVFWGLRNLVQGEMIEVRLGDGTVYRYRVAAMATVDQNAAKSDLGRILGPTEQEVITLITCNGTFDPAIHTYKQRLIVRAERITEGAAGEAPYSQR